MLIYFYFSFEDLPTEADHCSRMTL